MRVFALKLLKDNHVQSSNLIWRLFPSLIRENTSTPQKRILSLTASVKPINISSWKCDSDSTANITQWAKKWASQTQSHLCYLLIAFNLPSYAFLFQYRTLICSVSPCCFVLTVIVFHKGDCALSVPHSLMKTKCIFTSCFLRDSFYMITAIVITTCHQLQLQTQMHIFKTSDRDLLCICNGFNIFEF